jgi:soluble lytic murein transglycosylase
MRFRSLVWGLALLGTVPAMAQPRAPGPDVMAAVRADRWPEAEIAAARYADPVARKVVAYYRMLAPHAASAAEIAAFMAENPDWPFQNVLARRLDEAIAAEPDAAAAAALCRAHPPSAAATLERCALAFGDGGEATAMARAAWIAGDGGVPWEVAFVLRWGNVLRPQEERARFDTLARRDTAAATRQATRLTGDDRLVALARLALRGNAPDAAAVLANVPAARRGDPLLVYEHAAWLRRAGQDAAALAQWLAAPPVPVPTAWQPTLWREHDILARQLLQAGNASGAYRLVAAHRLTGGEARLDAEFLAGFIALRKLHDPAAAAGHFRALMEGSHSAITLARGHYWLARASSDAGTVKAEYTEAAAWPSTFYGQLAILALGEGDAGLQRRILALHDPAATPDQALDFAGRDLARAAALLTGWGEPRRAQAFLLRLEEIAPDPADRALSARLAIGLGLPQTAIFIARRAGAQGLMLPNSGWPVPVTVPPDEGLPEPLVLGLIRQESSFDTAVVSPSGARGLMQLMPGTAKDVAREIGAPVAVATLTVDTDYNMRLGTHYLRAMLDRFGGCTPLAIAAYNAGPGRVQQWLAANGDPCHAGGVDMIDWLEQIPFSETRNYVQRVTENQVLYAARTASAGTVPQYPLAKWLH